MALGTLPPARIPEEPIKNLEQVSLTGYAQSKLIGERIVQRAVEGTGADATILRIGQIVGDTKTGVWKDNEALPLIIRTALTMGILPQMKITCEWLPVNTLADTVLQIQSLSGSEGIHSGKNAKSSPLKVYNLVSPHSFSWTTDLLPALSAAGLAFRPVSFETWIYQLRKLSAAQLNLKDQTPCFTDTQNLTSNPNLNPAIKLVDFFAEMLQYEEDSSIVLETAEAEKASSALRESPHVLRSGLLERMVKVWLEKWGKPSGE